MIRHLLVEGMSAGNLAPAASSLHSLHVCLNSPGEATLSRRFPSVVPLTTGTTPHVLKSRGCRQLLFHEDHSPCFASRTLSTSLSYRNPLP